MKPFAHFGRKSWLFGGLSISAVAGALAIVAVASATGFPLARNNNVVQIVADWCAQVVGGGGTVPATPTSLQAGEFTFALKIEHGRLPPNMRLMRVKQGDVLRLELSSDARQFVHVHGYEIQTEVAPSRVTELKFAANLTGRFPLHVHGAPGTVDDPGHEDVIANIEVYPR